MDRIKRSVVAVMPAFRPGRGIVDLVTKFPKAVTHIIVVDDCCPESTADLVEREVSDTRVLVLRNSENLGVGGATKVGFVKALEVGADIVVKVDADGQMDPSLIPDLIQPIELGIADYAKGNRFASLESVQGMPPVRLVGNAALSLISKVSSGYWSVSDPTNGFFAISGQLLQRLPLDKVSSDYFFESDMLFRVYLEKAVVWDYSMKAVYKEESSGLSVIKTLITFPYRYLRNFLKRIFYVYYVRDWSLGSFELPLSVVLISQAFWIGVTSVTSSSSSGIPTSPGTTTLFAISAILGVQFLISFLGSDIAREPRVVTFFSSLGNGGFRLGK